MRLLLLASGSPEIYDVAREYIEPVAVSLFVETVDPLFLNISPSKPGRRPFYDLAYAIQSGSELPKIGLAEVNGLLFLPSRDGDSPVGRVAREAAMDALDHVIERLQSSKALAEMGMEVRTLAGWMFSAFAISGLAYADEVVIVSAPGDLAMVLGFLRKVRGIVEDDLPLSLVVVGGIPEESARELEAMGVSVEVREVVRTLPAVRRDLNDTVQELLETLRRVKG